jgi:hypothetical protein
MGALRQGSWRIGFLLSNALYGFFYNYLRWRGLLMIGILPALLIRIFVKEPEVWVEKPAPADLTAPRYMRAAVLDFQGRPAGKHADDLSDDG